MSEKLDGVRGYWNGQRMISRHGTTIKCPEWFFEQLPKEISLDGELWLGYGSLEILNGILNSGSIDQWKNISFMVFDLPTSNKPYEIRMCDLSSLHLPNHIQLINIERCKGNHHLQQSFVNIIDNGGEGLMMNKPGSIYICSRVENLLKVKVCIYQALSNLMYY